MDRLKVAIIFGGCSEEHPISVKSAQEVAKHLDIEKYEPFYIGITKSGAWKFCDGKLGEDGAMQGLLELSGIPYVGCDIQSSALCMDKSLAYIVARNAGIATPNFWIVTADEDIDADRLPYPVVVKPARSGSSFGVSKVSRKEELLSAVETARQYDSKVLIEEAVVGSEVGCAILGNDLDLIVGEVDQIRLSHGFFRIHQENKPESGSENSTVIVPADISAEARLLVYSRYPRMMAGAGLPFAEVIDRMVSFALNGKDDER